jgi:hypothetical protein
MEKIKNLSNKDSSNFGGLIVKGHVNGAIGGELFAEKVVEFAPQVLILSDENDNYLNYNIELDRINEGDQFVQFAFLKNEMTLKFIKVNRIKWQF